MDKLLSFLGKAEGRDKLLKLIQYFGRFMKAVSSSKYSIRLMNLSYSIRHSRQIFRLGKSSLELSRIGKTIKKEYSDNFTRVLEIFMHASLCTRWIFDNLSVLSYYKVFRFDHRELTKAATTAWVLGLVFSLCNCSREMMKSYA